MYSYRHYNHLRKTSQSENKKPGIERWSGLDWQPVIVDGIEREQKVRTKLKTSNMQQNPISNHYFLKTKKKKKKSPTSTQSLLPTTVSPPSLSITNLPNEYQNNLSPILISTTHANSELLLNKPPMANHSVVFLVSNDTGSPS